MNELIIVSRPGLLKAFQLLSPQLIDPHAMIVIKQADTIDIHDKKDT